MFHKGCRLFDDTWFSHAGKAILDTVLDKDIPMRPGVYLLAKLC